MKQQLKYFYGAKLALCLLTALSTAGCGLEKKLENALDGPESENFIENPHEEYEETVGGSSDGSVDHENKLKVATLVLPEFVGTTYPVPSPTLSQPFVFEVSFRNDEETEGRCFTDVTPTTEKRGPQSDDLSAEMFSGNVLFVDAQAAANGSGTMSAPYQNISEALAQAASLSEDVAILVAGGMYVESNAIILDPGIYLFGGFDVATWARDLVNNPTMVQAKQGVTVRGDDTSLITIVDGFEFERVDGLEVLISAPWNNSELSLRNNTFALPMSAYAQVGLYGDTHRGIALDAVGGSVHAIRNRFIVDSDEPNHVFSDGITMNQGCLVAEKNHFVSIRTSINTYKLTEGHLINNLIEDGYNGVATSAEAVDIVGNTIGLQDNSHGCGYAIYMGKLGDTGAKPAIKGNTIILQGGSGKGINEAGKGNNPTRLVDNHYILKGGHPKIDQMIYGDADQPHTQERVNKIIYSIQDVNAMQDILENQNNTLEDLR